MLNKPSIARSCSHRREEVGPRGAGLPLPAGVRCWGGVVGMVHAHDLVTSVATGGGDGGEEECGDLTIPATLDGWAAVAALVREPPISFGAVAPLL